MSTALSPVVLAAGEFVTPSIDYRELAPIFITFGAAIVGVLFEAFLPARARRPAQLTLVFASLVAAFAYVVVGAGTSGILAEGSVAVDGPTWFLQGTVLLIAFVGAMLMAERMVDPAGDGFAARASALPGSEEERAFTERGWLQTEVWPLFLFCVSGMLLFPASNDLLMMFIALELLSLPLYLLVGMARRRRLLSQEAALKYFLLGAFSSAFFLYGAALLYGFAGSLELGAIAQAFSVKPGQQGLVTAGIALVAVGLLFKVGSAPFHQWTPDVYQGAPTSVTAFMSAATKVAAFGAMLRLFYVGLEGVQWDWRPLMWVVAIVTMVVGSLFALTQTDIKRMLAYSSVAHAGFILTGVLAVNPAGLSAVLFYLLAYGFTSLGAFAVVSLVRDAAGEATHLSQWAGLGRTSPVLASAFALFLLALAGIPLTSGFTGKFAVFAAAIEGGATPVVIVGVLASAVAAFFYVRVIVLMFFSDPPENAPRVVVPSVFTASALAIGVGVTVILGVAPQAVLDLAQQANVFVR